MIKLLHTYMILINIIGLFIMFSDKQKAKRKQYRIPEKTLWLVAFLGGAIGTTLGMSWFRHKTNHLSFKNGFPLLAIVDVFIWIGIANWK